VTVGQLSAGLAHEIGSPLQILNGRARALLTRADATPEIKRNAEILVAQSERVTRIVEQLLRFARRRTLHLADVDLRRSAQAVLDLLDHEARRRGVTISFTCADDLPQLVADADQLQQIVLNLVANALKATPSGGSVRVSMKQDTFQLASGMPVRPSITLTVEDTGVGMEEDQVNRAFEPFFTNWADGHGTGLGLAVVRAIVTDHGGTVGIASRPGTGTRVTVQLPVDGATSQAAPEVA
jgi:signal transduction histidine kinase